MENRSQPHDAIGTFALCLSGGGTRAAAFHLGTLSYLDRVGVLPGLRILSTVSGGTFAGACYAMSVVERQSFDRYFNEFYSLMRDTHLVEHALEKFAHPRPEVPSGRCGLIVSTSGVYASIFLKDEQGRPDTLGKLLDADIHIDEVMFNTTEFRHGENFRFQRRSDPTKPIGSDTIHISPQEARDIRLADIVAASSCVPGGFEPLAFPDDFAWPAGKMPDSLREKFLEKNGAPAPVGLMDGGIFDNQGIQSAMEADEDRERRGDPATPRVGVFIISDVDQELPDIYPFPPVREKLGGPSMGMLEVFLLSLAVLCVLSLSAIGIALWEEIQEQGGFRPVWEILLYFFPASLLVITAVAALWLHRKVRTQVLPYIPQVGSKAWRDLRRIRLNHLIYMLQLRLGSLLAVANTIFMKRIRALVYDRLFFAERYQDRRISNLVSHLAPGQDFDDVPGEVPEPSPALRKAAGEAASMRTALWFERDDQLPCLVATGQATICYNLMKFLYRRYGKDPAAYPEPAATLWRQLAGDWQQMCRDPNALWSERLGKK